MGYRGHILCLCGIHMADDGHWCSGAEHIVCLIFGALSVYDLVRSTLTVMGSSDTIDSERREPWRYGRWYGTVVDGEMRDRRDTVPTADFIPVLSVSGRRSLPGLRRASGTVQTQ